MIELAKSSKVATCESWVEGMNVTRRLLGTDMLVVRKVRFTAILGFQSEGGKAPYDITAWSRRVQADARQCLRDRCRRDTRGRD